MCSELEKAVSEWGSGIAVSLNVIRGVRLIKSAKMYMFLQNTTHSEVVMRLLTLSSAPLHVDERSVTVAASKALFCWSNSEVTCLIWFCTLGGWPH